MTRARRAASSSAIPSESAPRARPYRAALPEPAALLELDRAAGSQLDPAVVDALRSVLARPRNADPDASSA